MLDIWTKGRPYRVRNESLTTIETADCAEAIELRMFIIMSDANPAGTLVLLDFEVEMILTLRI